MENKPIAPALTVSEIEAQIKELQSQLNAAKQNEIEKANQEFLKCHNGAATFLMLAAQSANSSNQSKLMLSLYLSCLMQAASEDAQQAAYQKAKAEAQRLVDSELPKSELPTNLLTQTIQRPTNENEQF